MTPCVPLLWYNGYEVRKMWKFIYTIVSIMIIIPVLFIRSKIYEWFYNDVIRIIPEFIWKPLDLIIAIGIYSILAVAIYQIIDEHNEKYKLQKEKEK